MNAMVDRSLTVNGVPTSLADLGYIDVGLDDCWQLCGSYGPNAYTYHNCTGSTCAPVVDTALFPSLGSMVDYAHSLNLTAGWYHNNCRCSDHCSDETCYAGDVNAIVGFGFDSVKLDGALCSLSMRVHAVGRSCRDHFRTPRSTRAASAVAAHALAPSHSVSFTSTNVPTHTPHTRNHPHA
jgi:hypothetical protein